MINNNNNYYIWDWFAVYMSVVQITETLNMAITKTLYRTAPHRTGVK